MYKTENVRRNKLGTIKKIVSKCFALCFLMASVSVFSATNINDDRETEVNNSISVISVQGDAFLYNGEAEISTKLISQDSNIIKGEIFLVDGALVYNSEILENVKITKLATKKAKTFAKAIKEIQLEKTSATHFNSLENSTTFSLIESKKIVFSQSKTEYFSKAVIFLTDTLNKDLYFLVAKQNFAYTNPIFTIPYFSGKHSVRPPTYFS